MGGPSSLRRVPTKPWPPNHQSSFSLLARIFQCIGANKSQQHQTSPGDELMRLFCCRIMLSGLANDYRRINFHKSHRRPLHGPHLVEGDPVSCEGQVVLADREICY